MTCANIWADHTEAVQIESDKVSGDLNRHSIGAGNCEVARQAAPFDLSFGLLQKSFAAREPK